jgi:hypothetical protein
VLSDGNVEGGKLGNTRFPYWYDIRDIISQISVQEVTKGLELRTIMAALMA